ncbi:MAG TPA: peroxidase [candidate division Zixibacteria bacterium]|nr:peroxidase [candidate division Zixibacteria bacterium]
MAFIDYIEYDDAPDNLKKLYDRYGGKTKTPANIVRIAGTNPPAMKAHLDLYRAIMFQKSDLSRHQREMIAVVVSSINQCHY